MTAPPVQFCVNQHGRRLAYAMLGQGPLLVFPPGWISHLGVLWEEPGFRHFVSALAQHNTVVWFDRQGCGFSSRDRSEFSLEEDLLDLETVVAQLPDRPLSLFAYSCAGPLAVTYAVRHPERVTHLILYGTFQHGGDLGPAAVQQSLVDIVRASWGLGARLLTELFVPSQSGEVDGARWFVRLQRESTSSTTAACLLEATYAMDVTPLLRSVRTPTLVLHRASDRAIPERAGRELAVGIPGARFVVLEGSIHLPWLGDSDALLHAITDFLGEPAPELEPAASEPAVEPARYQLVHLVHRIMNSFRVFRSLEERLLSSVSKERCAEKPRVLGDRNRNAAFDLPVLNTEISNASADFGQHRTRRSCGQRSSCWPTSIPSGVTWPLPGPWVVPTGRYGSGGAAAERGRRIRKLRGQAGRAFFPSAVRARVTALACTLPRASGKPLSRWSASELAAAVIQRGIVSRISASTLKRWLRAEQIKPWQYRCWQRPTDPRFLEKAIPILDLYERAQELSRKGHIIVCADEKTSIQARKATGGTTPAGPGHPLHVGDRYHRQGAVQLFAGLLVHRGETLARCFARKGVGEI